MKFHLRKQGYEKECEKRSQEKVTSSNQSTYIDPLTGGRFISDRVYEFESDLGKTATEWEFGENRIIGTFASQLRGGNPYSANTTRYVLMGSFSYAKDGSIGGVIDFAAGGDYIYGEPPDDETISVSRPGGINSFSSYTQSQSILRNTIGENYLFFYARNATPENIASNASNGIFITTDKSGLAQFGLSSIFAGDWWIDPFSPNLV